MNKKKLTKLLPLFLSVAVFILILILDLFGVFKFLEYKSYDHRIEFCSKYRHVSDDIIFIEVDQESINKGVSEYGWSWPWPRDAYGKIARYLDEGGALSCTYDILFTEDSVLGSQDDEDFARGLSTDYTKTVIAQLWNGIQGEDSSILKPIPVLEEAVDFVANTTSCKDSDGIIRRARVTDNVNGEELTFLGFGALKLLEEDLSKLPYFDGKTLKLNYKGSIDNYAHYSAYEVLESINAYETGAEPYLYPEDFADAHVFVLYYAPGLYDICSTPLSTFYPGAGVSITALDNYLTSSFIKTAPAWINILVLLFFSLIAGFSMNFSKKRARTYGVVFSNGIFILAGILLLVIYAYTSFYFLWDVKLVAPLAGFVISFFATASADYFLEGKQRRFIKNAFSQYLSPAVIGQLVNNPEKLKLGGERRNISIFFSDVQSFTTLSEGLSPEKLTDLLNVYLSAMSRIILETGGTIDKYEGDAIIAFWNAPAEIPDHSLKALEAAVKCQEKLKEMESFFVEKVGRPMWTRIGLNTGDAVVGNMGSENRFDYTMFGDSVNLASRLEGLNKQFGTYIMCSQKTKEDAEIHGCKLCFRELGKVQVVGKTEAVQIFEPMSQETKEERKEELFAFETALGFFYSGELETAMDIFTKNKNDPPSQKYAEKCKKILSGTANWQTDWKGVWVAESK